MLYKLSFLSLFLLSTIAYGQNISNRGRGNETNAGSSSINSKQPSASASKGSEDEIIFLMLRIANDSLTGKPIVSVTDKVNKPGTLKNARFYSGMTRLPFLSFVFYRGSIPLDSLRQNYPLRERIQNTRSNKQGYQDVEVSAREIFIRFQKNDADRLKVYFINETSRQEALTINL